MESIAAATSGADFTSAGEPFALFEAWFAEAASRELNDPNAMSLATAGPDGFPNVRIVLLKGLDAADSGKRGFVFYTNTESAKGRELASNPRAALLFHWKSLQRQVRIRGPITPVLADEADAYYASRPRGSRVGAWASQQSRPLASRAVLEDAVREVDRRFPGDPPRPPHWSGYRLTPLAIEFWHDRPFRLHDRIVFTRESERDGWVVARLYP